MDTEALLIELEDSLHSSMVRKSKVKLESLLSNDFMEIGASGRVYGKVDIIRALLETNTTYEIESTDFEFRQLSPGIAQLVYKSKSKQKGAENRYAIRNSLWKLEGNQWKMIFHQGSVTQAHNW